MLVSMRTGDMVGYTNMLEESIKLMILSSPIGLDCYGLSIKQSLNKILKITKALENLRLMLDQVDPSKFAKIINKACIIFESAH
jgi:hypothetical protein